MWPPSLEKSLLNVYETEYEEHFPDDLTQAEKTVLHMNLPYNLRKISQLFLQKSGISYTLSIRSECPDDPRPD